MAIDFLTKILSLNETAFDVGKFQAVKHKLANGDHTELFKLVVRWLLTGNHRLCESVAQLLNVGERAAPFDASTQDSDYQAPTISFSPIRPSATCS